MLSTHDGVTYKEYVYLNGMKVAIVEDGNISYIHNNYLGVPKVITDSSGAVVWEGDYKPFGEMYDVNGTLSNNIRFPGQYQNEESGYSYNYFRDYDPTIGRYLQSDPIGLNGGINSYGYAIGNPVFHTDPTGEVPPLFVVMGVTPVVVALIPVVQAALAKIFVYDPVCDDNKPFNARMRALERMKAGKDAFETKHELKTRVPIEVEQCELARKAVANITQASTDILGLKKSTTRNILNKDSEDYINLGIDGASEAIKLLPDETSNKPITIKISK